MKKLKNTFVILLTICLTSTLMLVSCNNDEDNPTPNQQVATTPIVYQEENFLYSYLVQSGLEEQVQTVGDVVVSNIEYLSFSAATKGKINSFSFKVPPTKALNPVTIILSDAETGVSIKEITTNTSEYIGGRTKKIILSPAIELVKDKKYRFSLISKFTYERRKFLGDVTYPIQAGNIKILGFSETNISTLVNTNYPAYYYGDFSFDFQRTE